jgi:hypothetical protein
MVIRKTDMLLARAYVETHETSLMINNLKRHEQSMIDIKVAMHL